MLWTRRQDDEKASKPEELNHVQSTKVDDSGAEKEVDVEVDVVVREDDGQHQQTGPVAFVVRQILLFILFLQSLPPFHFPSKHSQTVGKTLRIERKEQNI